MEENQLETAQAAETPSENPVSVEQPTKLKNAIEGAADILIDFDDEEHPHQEIAAKTEEDENKADGINDNVIEKEEKGNNEMDSEEEDQKQFEEVKESMAIEIPKEAKENNKQEEEKKEKLSNSADADEENDDQAPSESEKPKVEEKSEDPTMYNGFPKRLLENHIQQFEEDGTVPSDTTERAALTSYIRHLNVESVIDGDYPNAERYEKLLKTFVDACLQAEAKYEIEKKETDIDFAIARTEEQLEALKDTYIKRVVGAKQRDQQDIKKMMQQQENELTEFDDFWSEENNLRIFSKPSAHLLNLRAQEKRLLIAKMFDEADQIKKEADKLEKKEAAAAANEASVAIAAKRKQLEAKQRSDLIKLRQHSVKIVDDISNQYNKDKAAAEARLKKLKKDKLMLMQTPPAAAAAAVVKAQNNNAIISRGFGEEPLKTVSPRSKARMDAFRQSGQPRRLILKPVCPGSVKPSRSGKRSRAQKHIVI